MTIVNFTMREYENPLVINPYWMAFQVLFKFILVQLCFIGLIVWWVCDELLMEYHYYQKYGPAWRQVYEQYHGTVFHAHLKIAMALSSLLAISLILVWFYRQTFHKHAR